MHNLDRLYFRLTNILDVVLIFLSFWLSWIIKFNSGLFNKPASLDIQTYLLIVALHIPFYLLFFTTSRRRKIGTERWKAVPELLAVVRSNVISLLLVVLIFYLFKLIDFSRIFLFIFVVVNIILSFVQRAVLRRLLFSSKSKITLKENILLVGYNSLTQTLAQVFERENYNILGYVDEKEQESQNEIIGNLNEIEEILKKRHVDEIIIGIPLTDERKINYIVDICEKYGIRTYLILDYFRYVPSKAEIEKVNGIPLVNIRYSPLDEWTNRFIKRSFDIVVSLIGLIICLPLFIIIAILIKLTSEGPVLFVQERVGYNRRIFKMHKFRTMYVQNPNEEKIKWTTKDDPRRTPVGKILRRLSLDELPQLWDVLIGNMSLVGPRPERPYFVEKFKEEIPKYMIKHRVRPGMTGWAQIHGLRGDTSIEERIKYDIWYIENWSFWLDIKIIFATIFKGKFMENAY
ncbi:Undecaprenyl-phosphate glucose phosphotransferase [Caldicellulosiruptor acetigenus I77R1B]|uniref:Undecaprenyl-phosphate glucose phosphotransferase n=1 Tax=Caldicellulosiruptor acetigenus (strain ATCC 700853 / DSM 12137 / I77R1B) TaxID=632335 RepID=E4S804_CALA7|nr:undecaprenyl-phosphate glucose phosphotransferase [Caldicellulosiruptor acetigenus]ADQ41904.1 Undecaprenyl-phosphate glucose phosphotransferase [Caldicellulosiruptor acetigenus I77R1B]